MRLRTRLLLVNAALLPVVILLVWVGALAVLKLTLERSTAQVLRSAEALLRWTVQDRIARMAFIINPLTQDAKARAALEARGGVLDANAVGSTGSREQEDEAGPDPFLASWVNEFTTAREDLVVLLGADGKIAFGQTHPEQPVDARLLSSRQVRALLQGLGEAQESATMLWSGPRLRSEIPGQFRLERQVYLAQAAKLSYATPEAATGQLIGIALVATSQLDLERLSQAGADVLFTDGEAVLAHTLDNATTSPVDAKARATAAAAWLQGAAATAGPRKWMHVVLAGASYEAIPLDLPQLVAGPVKLAILYSTVEVDDLRRRIQVWLAAGALALLVLMTALGLWHVADLSRPLLALSSAATAVGGGTLDVNVSEQRKDELGDLAREFNRMVQGLRERARASRALGRYLSPEMATALVSGPEGIELSGDRRPLTILFGDIAGFTSISEKNSPEVIVQLLNAHLDQLVPILSEHAAYIDKFEGDAIMAFWNAPIEAADHALRACAAVLALRDQVTLRAEHARANNEPVFMMRWGLNTGDAVVGNLGASKKVNYTAIGDAVNLASRLEGANKLYGTQILVGEGTYALAAERFEFRELDRLHVKGKDLSVRVFELLAHRGGLGPELAQTLAHFEEGRGLYAAGKLEAARQAFEHAWENSKRTDAPSAVFIERCRTELGATLTEGSFTSKDEA